KAHPHHARRWRPQGHRRRVAGGGAARRRHAGQPGNAHDAGLSRAGTDGPQLPEERDRRGPGQPQARSRGQVVSALEAAAFDYAAHDATGLADLVRRREVSAGELLEIAIARADAVDPRLNAITS